MASFFDLPAELRNSIYEYCFSIHYVVYLNNNNDKNDTDSSSKPRYYWSQPPKNLHLLLICRQIHAEASSLLYQTYLQDFEYETASIADLRDLCLKIPRKHRGRFRALLKITRESLSSYLPRIGLGPDLPWRTTATATASVTASESGRARKAVVTQTLRGDCFRASRSYPAHDAVTQGGCYDRISIYGHLGRLQWQEDSEFPRIVYHPPPDRPRQSVRMEHGLLTPEASFSSSAGEVDHGDHGGKVAER